MLLAFVLPIVMMGCFAQHLAFSERVRDFGLHSQVVDALDGLFVVPKRDFGMSTFLRQFGQFEKPTQDLIKSILHEFTDLDSSENNIILDLGGNLGIWSVPLSTLPQSTVYSFEPQRYMLAHFRATLLLNGIHNIIPVHAAVGNYTGHVQINDITLEGRSDEFNFGGLSLLGALNHKLYHIGSHTSYSNVPMITLDHFYETQLHNQCPKFIKLDIEHYELYALMSARIMLQQCKPLVVFESHCALINKPVFLMLSSLGYRLYWIMQTVLDYRALDEIGLHMDFGGMAHYSEEQWNQAIFFTLNVMAIPNSYAQQAAAKYSEILHEVDVKGGMFKVEAANITYCFSGQPPHGPNNSTTRCGQFYVHKFDETKIYVDDNGNTHGSCFEPIGEYIAEYWQHYKYIMTK
ncbi:FkbM family methyltransferase [archaeon]|nr:MAG: FkbM family methyltransferase [archaeon]